MVAFQLNYHRPEQRRLHAHVLRHRPRRLSAAPRWLGGSGTILGAFLGALVLAILLDGFNLIGISANAMPIIFGGAILLAMIANVQLARLRRGREGLMSDPAPDGQARRSTRRQQRADG